MKKRFQHFPFFHQQGFSLIELLVAMVIAVILLMTAVPSLKDFIRANRVSTNTNTLVAALNLARSEAVKRNTRITVRHKGGTGQVWDAGWDIFTDLDADGTFDAGDGEIILRTYPALPSSFTLRTGANFSSWTGYLASGRSTGSGGPTDTFRLCADDANTATSRAIIISSTGRARSSIGTNSCP